MIERLQGTDGIRREVRVSTDPSLAGMSALNAFLEQDVITEEFVELYTYAYVRDSIDRGRMQSGDSIVVGWDPRDREGIFTGAALRGVSRAGGKPLSIGIVPTPLVPMYMIYKGAAGGIMLTASHNPPDQNGIKLFAVGIGLKPLPFDDHALTQKILKTRGLPLKDFNGPPPMDKREEAMECFTRFSLDPQNSWVEKEGEFSDTILIVDPANGSFSGLAAGLFRSLGFDRVIEVSADTGADVNRECGVVELEGTPFIGPDLVETGCRFGSNKAVREVFAAGRSYKKEIREGRKRVSAAVFDADGDRLIRLDYDPFRDGVIVLSGDETAFHQAAYLMERYPARYKDAVYVNTVESDLNAASAAATEGFTPVLTGVGDKWILLEAAFTTLAAKGIDKSERNRLRAKEKLSGEEIAGLLQDGPVAGKDIPFVVGAEESGHTITTGYLQREDGRTVPLFCGNGFKGAVNSLVATGCLFRDLEVKEYYARLARPFPPGFKKTLYTFYTDRSKIGRGNRFREEVEAGMRSALAGLFPSCEILEMKRPEEPDMLYLSLLEGGEMRAGVYVRNSGTEDKTGINLRGRREDADALNRAGDLLNRFLLAGMKDHGKRYALAEIFVLEYLTEQGGSVARSCLGEAGVRDQGSGVRGEAEGGGEKRENKECVLPENVSLYRLLKEMEKGGLIRSAGDEVLITSLGEWYAVEVS